MSFKKIFIFICIFIVLLLIYSYNQSTKIKHNFYAKEVALHNKFKQYLYEELPRKNLYKRVNIPNIRKGEGINYVLLKENYPKYVDLYENKDFIELISQIAKLDLKTCPKYDTHRVGIYKYSKNDDYVNWHYDTSFYNGNRITVLVLLQNCNIENKSNLYYNKDNKTYKFKEHIPYNMIIFDGDKVYHTVSKYNYSIKNKERIVLTMEYVTDPNQNIIYKWIDKCKNYFIYKF